MLTRRDFVCTLSAGAASVLAPGPAGPAQKEQEGVPGVRRTMSGPMSDNAYRPVRRAAKPAARSSMSTAQRDELEHQIHCQCGCTLDVYTCRTTDFTCPVSPAMHQDVVQLVANGYSGPEIIAAFRDTYGERVLMAPTREGFNWLAYAMPFAALAAGATTLAVLLRRGRLVSASGHAATDTPFESPGRSHEGVQATPEERARLDAAVRDDAE